MPDTTPLPAKPRRLDKFVNVLIVLVMAAGLLWFVAWSVMRNGWTGRVDWVLANTAQVTVLEGDAGAPNEFILRDAQTDDLAPGDRVSIIQIGSWRHITKLDQ